MSDVVVTVPMSFGFEHWIAEGDPAGSDWSGQEWGFFMGGNPPKIESGERVYIVCHRKLRGYAPLIRVEWTNNGFALVRGGGAVAVTIDEEIPGFRGCRYRWWEIDTERPFIDWQKR